MTQKPTIQPGDVYWTHPDEPPETKASVAHPQVVIRVEGDGAAVTVCALTTNARKISMPGNVLLAAGEANLPRQSIVEVAKVLTLNRDQLGDHIGTLAPGRVEQILAGIRFVDSSFFQR